MKILAVILLVLILAAAGLTFYVYRSKAMFLPALLGLGRFPQVKKESYYNGDGTFRQATADDSMAFLMQHPVFGGYKHMFFNAEDNVLKSIAPASYSAFMKAQGREEQLESSLESFNYLTAQVQQGRAWLLSDLYPEEDVEKDPYKSHLTGMFYQGEEGKPLAIVVPGGGFISNVTDCEGYPVAMELHRRGYSVLVLSYPIGKQLGQTEQVKAGRAGLPGTGAGGTLPERSSGTVEHQYGGFRDFRIFSGRNDDHLIRFRPLCRQLP